jgi:hypothetical protein
LRQHLLHVAPLERGRRHPRNVYGHQPGDSPRQRRDARMIDYVSSVTSGPTRPSPSPRHHPGHCKAIPNTVGAQADGTPPRQPLCNSGSPRQPDPRAGVRTTTKRELQRDHPRNRPWTSRGAFTTHARAEIRQDNHQITSTVRHAATPHLKPCGTILDRLPLVYKRSRRPLAGGGGDEGTKDTIARSSTLTQDIGIHLNQLSGTWRLLLLSRLASSPLRAPQGLAIQRQERTPVGCTALGRNQDKPRVPLLLRTSHRESDLSASTS